MQHIFETIKATAEGEIYLVGGAVRDLYLAREVTDFDFAYPGNAFNLARNVAEKINASFVPLDEERDIARLVIKHNKKYVSLDFAAFKGKDLYADLTARDFTINAMALTIGDDIANIIDPCNGRGDIHLKRIAAIKEDNLVDDPARILRGIRLAAELQYTIDEETFSYFIKHGKLIDNISWERIRDEIFKAFFHDAYNSVLLMERANIIDILIPELIKEKGVTQNKYHTLDVWQHTLEVLHQLEENVLTDDNFLTSNIKEYLNTELVSGRPRKALLKFAALIHDVAKPVVKKILPEKGVIFWNHENVGAEMARTIASRFVLSNTEVQFITTIVKNHMRPLFLVKSKPGKKAYFKFFTDTGDEGIGVMLHALADSRGGKAQDTEKEKALLQTTQNMLQYYFETYLPQHENPLITGKDVLIMYPKISGKKIGDVLQKVKEARVLGRVSSREEALKYIEGLSKNS